MGFREMKEQFLRLTLPFHVFFKEHVFTIVDGIGELAGDTIDDYGCRA
jgi:hypothetical protein